MPSSTEKIAPKSGDSTSVPSEPRRRKSPIIFSSLSPAKPTIAFDTYWRFAKLRQDVFFSRFEGDPAPWTTDPILSVHKFTNAYRASDRVSQYLIRDVIYAGPQDIHDLFFRIILFKLFNKIETWELLQQELGEISWASYRYSDYERVLGNAMAAKKTVYSAAYIMASGHLIFSVNRKHQGHLKLLELMFEESLPERIAECKNMRQAFELLLSYPLIGDFLAYQLVTDLNYSELTNFSETEFTMPGPGARDGIRKCFSSLGGLSEIDIIKQMADRQHYEFERLGLGFRNLWGRDLQYIDIQNIFCEVDKYSRVKHPEISGISGRTRIKQKFTAIDKPINYFYPPKWKLDLPEQPACERAESQKKLF